MKFFKSLYEISCDLKSCADANLEESIQASRRLAWIEIDELLLADWHLDLPEPDTEPWQWHWRSPSNRHYASTTQAYNALKRQRR